MTEVDINNIDIFKPCHGHNYHACLGSNNLQSFDAYAKGYFLAAKSLLDKLIDSNESISEHDLLINPILYSARHGVELCLKYILTKLDETDLQVNLNNTHSINELWAEFKNNANYDERLKCSANELNDLIQQIDKADPDGQDFRYPIDSAGNQTQQDKSIVDIVNARSVINYLSNLFDSLFDLTDRIVLERKLGSYCGTLNREQLKIVSLELPPRSTWKDSKQFLQVKDRFKQKWGLSNKIFSKAIYFIEINKKFS